MKCFAYLDCDNLQDIQKDVSHIVGQETDNFTNYNKFHRKGVAWHFLGKTVSKKIGQLDSIKTWLKKIKALPTEFSIIVTDKEFPALSPHTDDGPLCKINIPIMNNQGFVNRWYHNNEVIATAELKQPIVFNSHIPHDAGCLLNSPFYPRLVMPMSIANEQQFIDRYLL